MSRDVGRRKNKDLRVLLTPEMQVLLNLATSVGQVRSELAMVGGQSSSNTATVYQEKDFAWFEAAGSQANIYKLMSKKESVDFRARYGNSCKRSDPGLPSQKEGFPL